MPLYEYHCRPCRQDFELLVRGAEQPACPSCGGQQLTKLISVPAAHATGADDLPVCHAPPSAGCGLPQCGGGRCGMDD